MKEKVEKKENTMTRKEKKRKIRKYKPKLNRKTRDLNPQTEPKPHRTGKRGQVNENNTNR